MGAASAWELLWAQRAASGRGGRRGQGGQGDGGLRKAPAGCVHSAHRHLVGIRLLQMVLGRHTGGRAGSHHCCLAAHPQEELHAKQRDDGVYECQRIREMKVEYAEDCTSCKGGQEKSAVKFGSGLQQPAALQASSKFEHGKVRLCARPVTCFVCKHNRGGSGHIDSAAVRQGTGWLNW